MLNEVVTTRKENRDVIHTELWTITPGFQVSGDLSSCKSLIFEDKDSEPEDPT